jgi:hypothetical protein
MLLRVQQEDVRLEGMKQKGRRRQCIVLYCIVWKVLGSGKEREGTEEKRREMPPIRGGAVQKEASGGGTSELQGVQGRRAPLRGA